VDTTKTARELQKALEAIKATLAKPQQLISSCESLLPVAQRLIDAVLNPTAPTIKDVYNEVLALKNMGQQQGLAGRGAGATWAQVAAQGPPQKAKPTTVTHEVTIKITEQEEKKRVATLSNEQIVRALREGPAPAAKAIVAAKRLPSGDITIYMADATTKEALLEDNPQNWAAKVAQSAKATKKLFPVMVHNVCVANINMRDQNQTIKDIQEQNARLLPGLNIARIAWARKNLPEEKTHAGLVMDMYSAREANAIIQSGFVI